MKDQSHIEEMRAAIRGDRERALERRREPSLHDGPDDRPQTRPDAGGSLRARLAALFRQRDG